MLPWEAMEDSSLVLQGEIGVGGDSGRWSLNCPLREEFSVHWVGREREDQSGG